MTKQELLAGLTNTWQNFVFGLLLPHLIEEDAWNKFSTGGAFDISNHTWFHFDSTWYTNVIQNKERRAYTIGELEKALKRATLREGHELILLYCEETQQYPKYKAAPWFQFARIIRNVVSHKGGGTLRQWPNDLKKKGITRVSWRNRTLDINMLGQAVEFTHEDALKLLADQMAFAQNTLD